jgi:hypothetical protein
MFKRLLVAATLAASTLVTGPMSTQASAETTGTPCLATTTSGTLAQDTAAKCRWRHGCKYCKRHGKWRMVKCRDRHRDRDRWDDGYDRGRDDGWYRVR